ncbi:MAG: flagellar motor switch protein FliN [Proteobacteria bacterium]|nr:flagellar motor switch protein FliN [Pseudomonadota bacterium]
MAEDQDKLAQEWADALLETDGDETEAPKAAAPEAAADTGEASGDEALADEWAAALAETEQEDLTQEKERGFLDTQMKPAQFADMSEIAKGPAPQGAKRDLDFILDIPLEVSAELGRTKLLINELLQLGQGSVVELNKLAGEPLEIYVNGKLVARGEAVVINEKFGIRLTDIISPIERVKQLA